MWRKKYNVWFELERYLILKWKWIISHDLTPSQSQPLPFGNYDPIQANGFVTIKGWEVTIYIIETYDSND